MVSYENLGDIADGRRLLVGDFRGIGRSQLLFNNASDRNWWNGTFDGGMQEFCWSLAGNTSGFGDLLAGQMFWTGRFSTQQREQILMYNPSDQNWYVGTHDDRLGRLIWAFAGNTTGFGNLLAGHRFWRGRFTSNAQDQILFYYPGDQNWWLGSWDGIIRRLQWSRIGITSGFGNLLAGQQLSIGRFSRSDRDQVLMFNPSDQNWFLGSYDNAQSQLVWNRVSTTTQFAGRLGNQKSWVGRFSRTDFSDFLFYFPNNQEWQLASYDPATSALSWKQAGLTTGFGNLLAGHRFWTGPFSDAGRDQVLFYYPGDQNWWLSSYDPTTHRFGWSRMSVTSGLGDAAASYTGSFSRTDRTEMLVRNTGRKWWLGSVNESNDGFWWRLAATPETPRVNAASATLRKKLRDVWDGATPGCSFLVTRNGRPFADGSFGHARQPGASDGELAMTASSLVHVGSITKFFACVAILRLIEEWNRLVTQPRKAGEPKFDRTVHDTNRAISLDEPVLPLVRPFLDAGLLASYGAAFPGTNVAGITLAQVLNHASGLPRIYDDLGINVFEQALNGQHIGDLVNEPNDQSATRFELAKFVTALLKQNATFAPVYNNDAYSLPSAVIEATTGTPYAAWMKQHLFNDPRFDDLAPRVGDPVRSARYYNGNSSTPGNHHPDYTDFSLAGGYYVSATAFAEWVEAVMTKEPVGGLPILQAPELLRTRLTAFQNGTPNGGLFPYAVDRFRGYTKNGAATRAGGGTNASCAFMNGYGNERIFVFAQANAAGVDADAVRDTGMAAITEMLTRASGLAAPSTVTGSLRQTVSWSGAGPGVIASASSDVALSVETIAVNGVTAPRTRLLGSGPLSGGKARSDVVTVELHGSLKAAGGGYYVFRLASDDGAFVWLNDELIIDNKGDHGMRFCESDAIWLEANAWYPLRVRWYNAGGGADLSLEWRLPVATLFSAVPTANFSPEA